METDITRHGRLGVAEDMKAFGPLQDNAQVHNKLRVKVKSSGQLLNTGS